MKRVMNEILADSDVFSFGDLSPNANCSRASLRIETMTRNRLQFFERHWGGDGRSRSLPLSLQNPYQHGHWRSCSGGRVQSIEGRGAAGGMVERPRIMAAKSPSERWSRWAWRMTLSDRRTTPPFVGNITKRRLRSSAIDQAARIKASERRKLCGAFRRLCLDFIQVSEGRGVLFMLYLLIGLAHAISGPAFAFPQRCSQGGLPCPMQQA